MGTSNTRHYYPNISYEFITPITREDNNHNSDLIKRYFVINYLQIESKVNVIIVIVQIVNPHHAIVIIVVLEFGKVTI